MSLMEFLKNNNGARKIFGEKEIKIILNQLDGISLTQSERNRLSRDIKPKLNIIKEISQFSDEFELKKDQNARKLIDKAVNLILHDNLKDRIRAILLFGSHAGGKVTPRSDIDICVIFDNINLEEATKFRIRILGNFDLKMDVQVFNILPQKIKRSIARNHKILFKREGFDNTLFTIRYLKDDDYFIRMKRTIGEAA